MLQSSSVNSLVAHSPPECPCFSIPFFYSKKMKIQESEVLTLLWVGEGFNEDVEPKLTCLADVEFAVAPLGQQ